MSEHTRLLFLCGALLSAANLHCGHSSSTTRADAVEVGPQERVHAAGFSVARPAGFRVASKDDRADNRVAKVLDAGGLAFLSLDSTSSSTAFVLPGGIPFPATPTSEFCQEMAGAFIRKGNGTDLEISLDDTLGKGGCSVAFRTVRTGEGSRLNRGLFFSARGQTWQLQTTGDVADGDGASNDSSPDKALATLIATWKFEGMPPAKTDAFSVAVPIGFYEAADRAATEARARGGVMWIAEQAPVAGIIVASISVTPAVGAPTPVTEESCRKEMGALKKTIRGVEVVAVSVGGQTTCRAQGSDHEAPENQLSTTLVDVGGNPVWVLCRFHVVDDEAAEACDGVPASITPRDESAVGASTP